MRLSLHALVLSTALISAVPITIPLANANPLLPGGATTVAIEHAGAYSLPSANLTARRKGDLLIGNDFFEDPWVIAPSTTDLRDGLGPLFNVSACQSCHFNDGRGHAPANANDDADSLLVRLSRMPAGATSPQADPIYGGQVQDRGIPGVPAEGHINVVWTEHAVRFTDGSEITLRQPQWSLSRLDYGRLSDDTRLSFRVAPPMIGLGLLEAIADADLLATADPDDVNHDGISGRPNRVNDQANGTTVLGRFGWKAGQPTVRQQSAGAFNGDMGLTTTLFPQDHCTDTQSTCKKAPNGNGKEAAEVRDDILNFLVFYARNLAVPARRHANDVQVTDGEALFQQAGCTHCHTPTFMTQKRGADEREQSEQAIYPYTDLLLHDMGPALADTRLDGTPAPHDEMVEGIATASEWRTPPLWGIGLAKTVNAQSTFLHDGRARTLMEAVLWHDGEARAARDKVLSFDAKQRDALIRFVESL